MYTPLEYLINIIKNFKNTNDIFNYLSCCRSHYAHIKNYYKKMTKCINKDNLDIIINNNKFKNLYKIRCILDNDGLFDDKYES